MIIVSQDKEEIINFDIVTNIWINKVIKGKGQDEENKIFKIRADEEDNTFEIRAEVQSFSLVIGEYETKERAKEVLQEIVMLFKDEEMFHIRKSTLNNLDELAEPKYILKPVSRPKVFEMPED